MLVRRHPLARRAAGLVLLGGLLMGSAMPANAQITRPVAEGPGGPGLICAVVVGTLNAAANSGNGVLLEPCP